MLLCGPRGGESYSKVGGGQLIYGWTISLTNSKNMQQYESYNNMGNECCHSYFQTKTKPLKTCAKLPSAMKLLCVMLRPTLPLKTPVN